MNRPPCPLAPCRGHHPAFDLDQGDRCPNTWEQAVALAIRLAQRDGVKRRVVWHHGLFVRTWMVQADTAGGAS